MIGISAQVSVYPLEQQDITGPIEEVISVLRERGLPCQVGSMSSLTWGEDDLVFEALREAFARAAEQGPAVMVITVSNACPLPPPSRGGETDV
ncbi:MAG: thiamine-binding protein [Anaerolineae bacterium]|nr:thiamine-binding protein [Anaerolineae bacterium]